MAKALSAAATRGFQGKPEILRSKIAQHTPKNTLLKSKKFYNFKYKQFKMNPIEIHGDMDI